VNCDGSIDDSDDWREFGMNHLGDFRACASGGQGLFA